MSGYLHLSHQTAMYIDADEALSKLSHCPLHLQIYLMNIRGNKI